MLLWSVGCLLLAFCVQVTGPIRGFEERAFFKKFGIHRHETGIKPS